MESMAEGVAYSNNYLNWPREHAPTYLRRMLKHFLEVDWIADGHLGAVIAVNEDEKPDVCLIFSGCIWHVSAI